MKKRLIFLLLLCALLACMTPLAAFAEETDPEELDPPASCSHTNTKIVSNPNGTHTRKCLDCEESLGTQDCSFTEYEHITGTQTHGRFCTICDGTQSEDCAGSTYTQNADNTHSRVCAVCNSPYGTEICTFQANAYISGESSHSTVCVCGRPGDNADCTPDGAATCTQPSVCTQCHGVLKEALGHDWGDPVSNGDDAHTRTCTRCHIEDTADCSGGTASCTKAPVCTLCGGSYDEKHHTGTLIYQYKSDGTHSIRCTQCPADYEGETESCTMQAADCATPATCTLCAHAQGKPNPENHVSGRRYAPSKTDGIHNILCTGCGAVMEEASCASSGGNLATCTKRAVCDLCGSSYDDPLGHKRSGDGPCTREGCDCTVNHNALWTPETAGQSSVTCPECGKHISAQTIDSIAFSVTGYGYGLPISGLRATTDNPLVQVTGVTATERTRSASDTFEAGKQYDITVAYTLSPGYIPARAISITINGNPADQNGTAAFPVIEVVYSITYILNGGTHSNPNTYTASSLPLTLADPTKGGCSFAGWIGSWGALDRDGKTIRKGTTGDLFFTAKWNATVTFDANGHGIAPRPITVECGRLCPTPADPTDRFYAFQGWYTEPECIHKYNFSTPVTRDITLYAKWAEAYTLTFECNGGTPISRMHVRKNDVVNLTTIKPVRSGYYFCGWYRTSELRAADRVSFLRMDSNKTVYAKWAKMDLTNPKTGDFQHPELAGGILALSALGLTAIAADRKKRRTK